MSWHLILPTFLCLALIQILYFKWAPRYRLLDIPNYRSSHEKPTIRGGGIIIPLGFLGFSMFYGIEYQNLFIGLLLISIMSFWDDLSHLSPWIRITSQLIAMGFLFFELTGIPSISFPLLFLFIVAVGTLNAYNFMDGVNGMMASYSVVLLITLLIIDLKLVDFVDENLILVTLAGVLVFSFYNFRKYARCFSGDVGSVSIAFILVFFIGLLITETGSYVWILLLTVYGVDSVLTIIHRLLKRENIFAPHRSHLYQYYVNKDQVPHTVISAIYGSIQIILNTFIILNYKNQWLNEFFTFIVILGTLGLFYILLKLKFETKIPNRVK